MINIGIRQYGVDDTLPDVFSQQTFEDISLFMTDEDYREFRGYYIGINDAYYGYSALNKTIGDEEYAAYKKKYTKLNEGEEVYILKRDVDFFKDDYSEEQIDALREKLKIPTVIYAAFNEMLTVSSVSFLNNNIFLSSVWANFEKVDLQNPEEFDKYIKSHADWKITDYFNRLKEMSVEKNENGKILYGNSEKGLFMKIISGVVSGDFAPKLNEMDTEAKKQEIIDSLVNEIGYDAEYAEWLVGQLGRAAADFPNVAGEITSYIFELGNIDYKKFEYEKAGVDVYLLQINYIVKNGIFMLLYTVGSIAVAAAIIALSARAAANVARDLRRDVFAKVQSFSNAEFDKFSTSSLITRTSNDVSQLHSLLFLMIKNTFYALFIVGGGLYYLYKTLNINLSLLLLIALMIAVISVGVVAVYVLVMPKFLAGQKLLDKINLVTRERLSGVLVIRANDNEPREEEKYEDVNKKITKVNLFINRTMALLNPFMVLFLNVLGIGIIYLTVDRNYLIDGSILPGSLLAFLQYTVQIIYAFTLIAGMFVFLPRAVVAMKRVWEILDAKPTVADPEKPLDIDLDGDNSGMNSVEKSFGVDSDAINAEKEKSFDVDSDAMNAEREKSLGGNSGMNSVEKSFGVDSDAINAEKEKPSSINSVEKSFDIKFENVSFKYSGADAYALEDVSFEAKSGKTTAIVGVTGSGKTTLVNLILRFYDPTEGTVFVNGIDIKKVRQADLRKHIGFVSQQPTLFSGTIRENLSAGNENADAADMDRAIAVAKADDFVNDKNIKGAYGEEMLDKKVGKDDDFANGRDFKSSYGGEMPNKSVGKADDFVNGRDFKDAYGRKMPDKYDAVISREGRNISGGQKQRLSIARAVVRKPRLYILDDSFSALDYLTEANLRAELTREAKENNVGVIVISQRIASVLNADNIIALDGGKIIGRGTHSELMKICPSYAELARSQLPEDEL
jgi:ATP-binding cassette subfamily B protein